MGATAIDACQNGFRPRVVREAVGDGSKRKSLFDLDAKYADVVARDDALPYIERVGHNSAAPS